MNERLQVMYDPEGKCFVLLDESIVEKKRQLWTKYQDTDSKNQENKQGNSGGNMSPWKHVILPPRNSPRHAGGESHHSSSSSAPISKEQSAELHKNKDLQENIEFKQDLSCKVQGNCMEQNTSSIQSKTSNSIVKEVNSTDSTMEKHMDPKPEQGAVISIGSVDPKPLIKFDVAVVVVNCVKKLTKWKHKAATSKSSTEVPEEKTSADQQNESQTISTESTTAELPPESQVSQLSLQSSEIIKKKAKNSEENDTNNTTSEALQPPEPVENSESVVTYTPSDPVQDTITDPIQAEKASQVNPSDSIEASTTSPTTPAQPTRTFDTPTIELPKSSRKSLIGRLGSAQQTPIRSMSRLDSFRNHMKPQSPKKAEAEAYERSRIYWAGDPVEVSVICSAKDDARRRQNRYFNALEQEEPLLGDQRYQNMQIYDVHQLQRINRYADGLHRANVNSGTFVSSSSSSSSDGEYQEEKYHVGDRVIFKAKIKQEQQQKKYNTGRQKRRAFKIIRGKILCRFRQQIGHLRTRYLYQIKAIDQDEVFKHVSSAFIVGLEEDKGYYIDDEEEEEEEEKEEEEEEKFFEKGDKVKWYDPNTKKTYLAKVIRIHSSSNCYDIQTRTGRIVKKVPSNLLEYAHRLIW
jgi:hypothetical protein